jgi:predicted RNase H-like nuclease (RuvC/YqgF family)
MFAMGNTCRLIWVFVAVTSLLSGIAWAQDEPSLGDLARQQRQQKEQSKPAPGKDAKTSKVITNEEIPSHAEPRSVATASKGNYDALPPAPNEPKQPAEHWKSQIIAQKNQISTLQRQVDELNESIRFAPANCVANCVGWNERQREKQQRVELMQSQLEEEKRRLEDLQDSARKQGYGSSVYDP